MINFTGHIPSQTQLTSSKSINNLSDIPHKNKHKYKLQTLQIIISKLTNLTKFIILNQALQNIQRYSSAPKNNQQIFTAIYNKKTINLNQNLTARKKKYPSHFQTAKKPNNEFTLDTDDISTIIQQKSQRNNISNQSRIDLENLLQIATNKTPKSIITNNQHINKQMTYCISKKRSRTEKSLNNQLLEPSFRQDFYFKKIQYNHSKHNQTLEYSQTINLSYKKNKQKSPIQKIFIYRQPKRKLLRPSSQDFNSKIDFIQIPVNSRNLHIIQRGQSSTKQYKNSQSLSSKKYVNTCASGFSRTPNQVQCKFCSRLSTYSQLINNWRRQKLLS